MNQRGKEIAGGREGCTCSDIIRQVSYNVHVSVRKFRRKVWRVDPQICNNVYLVCELEYFACSVHVCACTCRLPCVWVYQCARETVCEVTLRDRL